MISFPLPKSEITRLSGSVDITKQVIYYIGYRVAFWDEINKTRMSYGDDPIPDSTVVFHWYYSRRTYEKNLKVMMTMLEDEEPRHGANYVIHGSITIQQLLESSNRFFVEHSAIYGTA